MIFLQHIALAIIPSNIKCSGNQENDFDNLCSAKVFFDNVLVLLFPWVGLDPLTSPVFSSITYQLVENQSEIDMH